MIGDAVLGVVLWLGPLVATSWYAAQATGLDPRVDQTLGAGVLWIGGDLVGLPFILIVVNRMSREDTTEGRRRRRGARRGGPHRAVVGERPAARRAVRRR